ncbi:hypothetical protein [Streptomyces sp. NPDC006739]|uniref:hypothetical protein n=1 Tax=Streptomyces sp. NPDC006739 TaxID=3364763 RepID=UPI00369FCED4
MTERTGRMFGPGDDPGRTVLPPDLSDVDLRTLRALRHPELDAAVARLLGGSPGLEDTWYSNSDDPVWDEPAPGERLFPVGSGTAARGREGRG